MAQLDFFFMQPETMGLVQFILKEGYSFVPNIHYHEKKLIFLNDISEININILKTRAFYLTHPSFTKKDFTFGSFVRDAKTIFYIQQKHGGPYLDLFFPITYERNGVLYYSDGFIGRYNQYYNIDGSTIDEGLNVVKGKYLEICKYIKNNTISIRNSSGRSYRISNNVLNNLKLGNKLVGFSDEQTRVIISSNTNSI